MRIRLNGTAKELAVWADRLRQAFDVHDVSEFTPWTRNNPQSKEGAIYVSASLRPEDQQRVVRATAVRTDQYTPLPKPRRELT